jgi:hypothetical protein
VRKYAAFDLEISKILPEGETDWKAHRPLGISCAAIATDDDRYLWYSAPGQDFLSVGACGQIVDTLASLQEEDGYTIVTWNGCGFDFDILAEESGRYPFCEMVARDHIDMMFQIFCTKGYPCGLDKAARGQGLPGKLDGMDGAQAPVLWSQPETRRQVLDYLVNDVELTLELAKHCERQGYIQWLSSGLKLQRVHLIGGWLTVAQCLEMPEPDTSWMSEPWPRSKFTSWMEP